MQLFLDIDGVLLNFEHAFVRWLNRTCNLELPEDYEAESWDFEEVLDKNTLMDAWHGFLESTGAASMLPLVPSSAINTLGQAHSVHLLTNFPLPHMEKRQANLAHAGFNYETLHYCGLHPYKDLQPKSKAIIIDELRKPEEPALFVDDHPDNCLDVHRNCPGVEVWLMSRRFNRDFEHPRIQRAKSWDCLMDRLG